MNKHTGPDTSINAGGTAETIPPRSNSAPAMPKDRHVLPIIMFADLSTISAKSWIVQRLLGAGEMSCWFGPPGSGKSCIAEDIGLHVAIGPKWQDRAVKSGAVLYVALERAAVVARRAIAFGREHEIKRTDVPFGIVRGPLDFRHPETADKIIATMKALAAHHDVKPRLIVIDTTSRALHGGDENSPKDMGLLIATLALILAALPGVHILLTHHVPADKERMRGHTSLNGAVDSAFHVNKIDAGRVAECTKSSDLDDEQRIGFALKPVVIGQDDHGDPITAPVVINEQPPAASEKKKRTRLPKGARVALNALREAVDAFGAVPPASNYIPPAVKAATIDQWRDYAYRRGVTTSDKPRARQAAFERARENLQDANAIGIWGAHVWIV